MSATDNETTVDRLPSRDALLRAAAELFAEKGPEAVSTREIASKACVNNGLIHRHFRTKEALLKEVLESLSAEISSKDEHAEAEGDRLLVGFFQAMRERETYWKLIARSMLDGQPIDRIVKTFPTMGRVIEVIREMQARDKGPDADPRAVAAMLAAVAFGWLVFEPWILAAGGFQEEEKEAAGRDVIRLVRRFVTEARR